MKDLAHSSRPLKTGDIMRGMRGRGGIVDGIIVVCSLGIDRVVRVGS